MRTMTLMAALAMVAATHSIATRTAAASDNTTTTATAIRTFDLPTVRVYATVESETAPLAMQAPRIHDLPPVRVHAVRDERDVADVRNTAVAMRPATARRASLAIPRGSQRRGIAPERTAPAWTSARVDQWLTLGCVVRQRLARVWPLAHCGDPGARTTASGGPAATVRTTALLDRRR